MNQNDYLKVNQAIEHLDMINVAVEKNVTEELSKQILAPVMAEINAVMNLLISIGSDNPNQKPS